MRILFSHSKESQSSVRLCVGNSPCDNPDKTTQPLLRFRVRNSVSAVLRRGTSDKATDRSENSPMDSDDEDDDGADGLIY